MGHCAPRWAPFAATLVNLAAFILALTLIRARGGSMENAALVTYNTSYIGQDPANYSSGLAANLSSLIPPGVVDPPSVTRYLGIADWYSAHYVSVCQGFWAINPGNGLLTATKINSTCINKNLAYDFSLADTISSQLHPSMQDLVSEVPSNLPKMNTQPPAILLCLGIVCSAILFIFLAITMMGSFHINSNSFNFSLITFSAFLFSSGIATAYANYVPEHNIGFVSSQFLAMTWSLAGLEFVVTLLAALEWKYELFTPDGEPITCYQKPPEVKSWLSLRKNRGFPIAS